MRFDLGDGRVLYHVLVISNVFNGLMSAAFASPVLPRDTSTSIGELTSCLVALHRTTMHTRTIYKG